MRMRRWMLMSLAIVLPVFGLMTASASAATNPPAGSGFIGMEYTQGTGGTTESPDLNNTIGAQLGVNPEVYEVYTDGTSWSTLKTKHYGFTAADAAEVGWDSAGDCVVIEGDPGCTTLELSTALCISNASGKNLASNASHQDAYSDLASAIYSAGWRGTIYRLGWEANGQYGDGPPPYTNDYCWAGHSASAYDTAFNTTANTILAHDPSAKFDFNMGGGTVDFDGGGTFATYFPTCSGYSNCPASGTFVDIVGVDEAISCWEDVNKVWHSNDAYTANHVWNVYTDAASVGLPWAVDEWGMSSNQGVGATGCGDDAYNPGPSNGGTLYYYTQMNDMTTGVSFTNPDPNAGTDGYPTTISTVLPDHQTYYSDNGDCLVNGQYPNAMSAYISTYSTMTPTTRTGCP